MVSGGDVGYRRRAHRWSLRRHAEDRHEPLRLRAEALRLLLACCGRALVVGGIRGDRDQQDSAVRLLAFGDRRDAGDVVDGIMDDLPVRRRHGLEGSLGVARLHL